MTEKEISKQIDFELSLAPGDEVEARICDPYGWEKFRAKVVRINAMSIRVVDMWDSGREHTVPRVIQLTRPRGKWSYANGVFPLGPNFALFGL